MNSDSINQKRPLRGLMNVCPARACAPEFLRVQDAYLHETIAEKGIMDCKSLAPLQPRLYLWQGDITTLKCDAIVNAANSGMTSCYVPNHVCIDNAIHTFAGIQLRLLCAESMQKSGLSEPTGQAKSPLPSTSPAAISCTPSAQSSMIVQQSATAHSLKAATAPA